MHWRARLCGLALLLTMALVSAASAREWTDEMFNHKVSAGQPFVAFASNDPNHTHSVIGSTRFYQAQPKDTFLDIARYYDLGYNELEEANPGVDPWVPPAGQVVLLPTEFVLPYAEYKGIVVNLPEMRLYYFKPGVEGTSIVITYPVGLGRDDWQTPTGSFKVREKTVNPKWVLPESIKEEHKRDGKPAPDFIEGGAPDNPLGKYRLRLTLPLYGIHGTDIPWGVGMQVSHGCVRLYPEDIERFFPMVPVGTPGQFVYQPVKVGARDGHIYVEIHKDIYDQLPGPYREAVRLVDRFGWHNRVDFNRVRRAVLEQSGVPIDVTLLQGVDDVKDELVRPPSAPGRVTAPVPAVPSRPQ
jgi:L,D-transpeptidase ErfK/SrfK